MKNIIKIAAVVLAAIVIFLVLDRVPVAMGELSDIAISS